MESSGLSLGNRCGHSPLSRSPQEHGQIQIQQSLRKKTKNINLIKLIKNLNCTTIHTQIKLKAGLPNTFDKGNLMYPLASFVRTIYLK